jgi:hypothetical protein
VLASHISTLWQIAYPDNNMCWLWTCAHHAHAIQQTLAEMKLQEELDEEAKEYFVVRKWVEASSLDNTEDIEMQPEDREEKGSSVDEAYIELSNEDDKTEAEGKVVPKQKQVWFFQVYTDMNMVIEVW